jgi:hypothetical protein
MIATRINVDHLPIELGDGLVLRRSGPEDAERLSDFNSRIHSDAGPDQPDEYIRAWTHDLLSKPHPTFNPGDFTIVEEPATGKIVSSMNLISQTWAYAGIPFKVGRPELVGTLPEYRNRGLVRQQFDVIHRWSAERGEKLQAITGIPYYYRLFGYEMAMNLSGGRVGFPTHVPALKVDETEPYRFRQATTADIPVLSRAYQLGCQRSLVACVWDEALWRYELEGKSKNNVNRGEIRIIETADGRPCGFIVHPMFSWHDMMPIQFYELLPEFSWREVTPSVIRYARHTYEDSPAMHGEKKPFGAFGMWFSEDHPVYHVIPDSLPRVRKPYAWYMRVVDVPDFVNLIIPVLEQRLASSNMAGFNGEVHITFYQDGMRLILERGKITCVEAWKPTPVGGSGEAGFPPHTFLQLLFGYRSIEMLKSSFADCWTDKDEIHLLLDALFPRQPSDLWPIA